jgi:nucleotide-binding universal stress UspA family protein
MGKPLFNRILCPVDFDGNSGAAIEVACEVAQGPEPVVYLLHVVPTAPALAGVPLEPYPVTGHDVEVELKQMIAGQARGQVRFELRARKGNPAKEILRAIGELGVDSVVILTHGRKGIGRLLLGSVAEKVVRESPCPVLTVR